MVAQMRVVGQNIQAKTLGNPRHTPTDFPQADQSHRSPMNLFAHQVFTAVERYPDASHTTLSNKNSQAHCHLYIVTLRIWRFTQGTRALAQTVRVIVFRRIFMQSVTLFPARLFGAAVVVVCGLFSAQANADYTDRSLTVEKK